MVKGGGGEAIVLVVPCGNDVGCAVAAAEELVNCGGSGSTT